MHKDAKKIARRIDDAFSALRQQGVLCQGQPYLLPVLRDGGDPRRQRRRLRLLSHARC